MKSENTPHIMNGEEFLMERLTFIESLPQTLTLAEAEELFHKKLHAENRIVVLHPDLSKPQSK